MTNRQLLQTSPQALNELDRQKHFLLGVEGTPMPCPACARPVNVFDAAGIDPDAYDFGKTAYEYRCRACGAELEQVVPFLAGGPHPWHWQLKPSWLRDQLRKAKAFDELGISKTGADSA